MPLVRVANTGVSSFISPYGEEITTINLDKEGTKTIRIVNGLQNTQYKKFGEIIFFMLILIIFGISLTIIIKNKRSQMRKNYLFTSESVSEGHPDKICDKISDTVVDLLLKKYPEARVACETMVSTNRTIIAGEYRLPEDIKIDNEEIEQHVRQAVKEIGYEQEEYHWQKMDFHSVTFINNPQI